jgi:hypothetical protein
VATSLIFSASLSVGHEPRYFLQALLLNKQELLSAPYKVKMVAKRLCLTERLVRDASLELAAAGLLVVKKLTDKVGRPGQEYEASPYLRVLIAETKVASVAHQELVVRLFIEPDIYAQGPLPKAATEKPARALVREDGLPAAPGAHGRLGSASRMILAALLVSADQCGFVSGLGESKLRAMTGLTAVAVRHQLKRLISLGFIRSHVPGVSSAVFKGSRVSSAYYLNLDHPQLGAQPSSRALAVYATRGPSKFETLAVGLPQEAVRALRALEPAVIDMLYHKLASCTSHLLALMWGAVDDKYSEAESGIAGMIAKELGQLQIGSTAEGEGIYWAGIHENFLDATREWARSLHGRLCRKVWSGYRPESVRLMPGPEQHDTFRVTTVFVYPAPQKQKACVVFWDEFNGRADHYGSEAELGFELRYAFGLLAAPA